MILYINTTLNNYLEVGIKKKNKFISKKGLSSRWTQAEKLLPLIKSLLRETRLKLKDIKAIKVFNYGGSYTSLRIGVITANALAYALKIPISGFKKGGAVKSLKIGLVKTLYSSKPKITKKK